MNVSISPVSGQNDDQIQAAIDTVAAAGGGTVTLASGLYEIDGHLGSATDPAISVKASVWLVLATDSTLRLVNGLSTYLGAIVGPMKGGVGFANGGIIGGVIDGNRLNVTGLQRGIGSYHSGDSLAPSTNFSVLGVTVQHMRDNGIQPYRSGVANDPTSGWKISGCFVDDCQGFSYYIDISHYAVVTNCRATNGNRGFVTDGSSNCLVAKCEADGMHRGYSHFRPGGNNTFVDCYAANCTYECIDVEQGGDANLFVRMSLNASPVGIRIPAVAGWPLPTNTTFMGTTYTDIGTQIVADAGVGVVFLRVE